MLISKQELFLKFLIQRVLNTMLSVLSWNYLRFSFCFKIENGSFAWMLHNQGELGTQAFFVHNSLLFSRIVNQDKATERVA